MKFTIGLLTLTLLALLGGSASALDSRVQLSITPRFCNVDIVNDGSNQTIQLSSSLDCQQLFPLLPVFPVSEKDTLVPRSVQSAPNKQTAQLSLRSQVEGTLSPIATKADRKTDPSRSTYLTPTVLGVGLALGATAIGIDLALFEFQYSRKVVRWSHKHIVGRLSKN